MQKLIELLNEYENTDNWENGHQVEFRESKIISKKFGFIEWLVDNDKIDIEKVIDTAKSFGIDTYYYEEDTDNNDILLLMVLAVEDNPIEFLISIL